MCIANNLQRHIQNLTGDGEAVARFLVDTMQGKHADAKYHHKLEAMNRLVRFGFSEEEQSHFCGVIPTPEELAAEKNRHSREACPRPRSGNGNPEGQSGATENSKLKTINFLDILNYDIAHLIRQETADGHTIAEFLSDVMTRRDKPFTPKKLRIRHADRMAAAREILRRGFGHFGRRRKLVVDADDDNNHAANDYDTLHTDLAKRMREYSEHGAEVVRFLLDVMEDTDTDEPYTWLHRISAAIELLRRGWDTNYDAITPQMLQDYWRDQQSTRLTIAQKKDLAGLPVEVNDYDQYDNKDYQAIARRVREAEDREPAQSLFTHKDKVRKGEKSEKVKTGAESPTQSPFRNGAAIPCEQTNPPHPEHLVNHPDDDKPDCYYEPLNPDDEAAFNYQCKIESGEYEESEITIRQPTPEDWIAHELNLAILKEIAAAEGVPVLPNPLAYTLAMPTIRGP